MTSHQNTPTAWIQTNIFSSTSTNSPQSLPLEYIAVLAIVIIILVLATAIILFRKRILGIAFASLLFLSFPIILLVLVWA